MRTVCFGAFSATLLLAAPAFAQQLQPTSTAPCPAGDHNRTEYCEERTYQLAATDLLRLDAGALGGIQVVGTDDKTVELKALVSVSGGGEKNGQQAAAQIRLETRNGWVQPVGPKTHDGRSGWQVSFELRVPRQQALELKATLGGITLENLTGNVRFETTNGGLHLVNLNGDVQGHTANGGVTIQLAGKRWEGKGLDVRTTNGGIEWAIPADYAAAISASTTMGGVQSDFEPEGKATIATVSQPGGKSIALTLGKGGAPLHVETTNGGIRVRKAKG